MATLALDTHKIITRLVEHGYTKQQAEGIIEVLVDSDFTTRGILVEELDKLRKDMDVKFAETKSSIIQWMIGIVIAQGAALFTVFQMLV